MKKLSIIFIILALMVSLPLYAQDNFEVDDMSIEAADDSLNNNGLSQGENALDFGDDNDFEYSNNQGGNDQPLNNNLNQNTNANQSGFQTTGGDAEAFPEAPADVSNTQMSNGINPAAPMNDIPEEPVPDNPPAVNLEPVIISNDFSGAPMMPGTMRIMADGEAPEEYLVEEGDTLFDVCSQLLDEGGYWPKLWAMNPQIKNPHFIWPGMKLRFFPGDEENPPFLEVVSESDIVPIDKEGIEEEVLLHGMVPDMDKAFEQTKVEFLDTDSQELLDEMNRVISVHGSKFDPKVRKFVVPGFIFSEEKEALGTVEGGLKGESMIGAGMKVLVENEGSLSVGTKYTVMRFEKEVENEATDEEVGYFYTNIAHVTIEALIDDGDFAVARVDENQMGVSKEDILVPYYSTKRVLPFSERIPSSSNSEGNIVAMQSEGRMIAANGNMVFIDRGANDGVTKGQYFTVYSVPGRDVTTDGSDTVEGLTLPIATIKIIDTTDVASVGFVVKNKKEVQLGDYLMKKG